MVKKGSVKSLAICIFLPRDASLRYSILKWKYYIILSVINIDIVSLLVCNGVVKLVWARYLIEKFRPFLFKFSVFSFQENFEFQRHDHQVFSHKFVKVEQMLVFEFITWEFQNFRILGCFVSKIYLRTIFFHTQLFTWLDVPLATRFWQLFFRTFFYFLSKKVYLRYFYIF